MSKLGWLHRDEEILNNSDIKKLLKGVDKMSTPSQTSYEQALETVKQYEQRQKDLDWIEKELSKGLQQFEQIKFQVNKGRKEVVFAGVRGDGQLKLTKSKCTDSDVFEESIGKLIAVKRALGENTKKVEELVESKKDYVVNIDIAKGFYSSWIDDLVKRVEDDVKKQPIVIGDYTPKYLR